VVIDGAHGPGSVPINLSTFAALGMEAYVGNLHKWLCCPKGSAFLWVADSIRNQLRPLVISHGANAPNGNQGRFRLEHDWIGTQDPSAILCLPKALQLLNLTNPEDQKQLLANRREVLLPARLALIDALQQKPLRETITPLFPDEFIASMVSVDLGRCDPEASYMYFYQAGFQIPVIPLKPHSNPERSFLRLSWFSYNTSSDLELLLKVCSCFNLR
jgi:isopenicillin-N epimerase